MLTAEIATGGGFFNGAVPARGRAAESPALRGWNRQDWNRQDWNQSERLFCGE